MAMRDEAKDYSVDLEDGMKHYEASVERALQRLADHGLDIHADRPKTHDGQYFDGRLPENVNSLPSQEIGELYSAMCSYADFVSGLRVTSQAEERNYGEQLELVKAKITKSKGGMGGNEKDRTADVLCDSRYVEANAHWLEAKTLAELVMNVEEAARRDLKTISRLIEVRKMEYEHGGRDENVNRGRSRGVFERGKGRA